MHAAASSTSTVTFFIVFKVRETDSSPWTIPLGYFPLPCSVMVRGRSGVSRVKVRVGSVGLGLGLVGLVLGLGSELGLDLWFGLGEEMPGGNVHREMPLK